MVVDEFTQRCRTCGHYIYEQGGHRHNPSGYCHVKTVGTECICTSERLGDKADA